MSEHTSIYFGEELLDITRTAAKENGQTLADFVCDAVRERLEELDYQVPEKQPR